MTSWRRVYRGTHQVGGGEGRSPAAVLAGPLILIVACGLIGACAPAEGTRRPSAAPADVIFEGRFVTLDSVRPRAEAVAVHDGRIIAVGTRQEVEPFAGPHTVRRTLPGVALPGFADAHAHPSALGDQLATLDLRALSKAAIRDRVARAAQVAGAGEWIRGSGWDQGYWHPAVFPVAADLDDVSHDHPVLLDRIDGHSIWLNSRALRAANITRGTPDLPGGRIIRDAQGDPTGILVDSAMSLAARAVPALSAAQQRQRMQAALAQYVRWGLTSVHDAGASVSEIALYRALAAAHELPIRMYVMASAGPAAADLVRSGPQIGIGDGLLTIRSIKVLLDGALGSRGAQMSAPYSDAPAERGLSLTSDATLDSIIRLAVPRGIQVNVHAIGDQANHRLLDAFARAGPAARALRFRDEHVSVLRDEDVPRFAQLGVIASMQPVFVGEYSRWAAERVGAERLRWVYRTRDLWQSGALIAAGTDYPASDAGDPVATLSAMVTRRGADGTPAAGWIPSQGVSVDATLRSMTAGAAYAAFEEHDLGALTVGRYADFTVLSDDPYAVAPDRLRALRVVMAVVAGRILQQ